MEDLKKAKIDTKTWQTFALDRKQWRVAIAQGVRAITADWEGRQAAERETRHAYNDRNAVQRLFMEPTPQRTSRADKLMERLRVDERGVSERQGNVDIPTPREPSRTTWMRRQYLAADRTEHE